MPKAAGLAINRVPPLHAAVTLLDLRILSVLKPVQPDTGFTVVNLFYTAS